MKSLKSTDKNALKDILFIQTLMKIYSAVDGIKRADKDGFFA
jgi:hypothetical protein